MEIWHGHQGAPTSGIVSSDLNHSQQDTQLEFTIHSVPTVVVKVLDWDRYEPAGSV